MAGVLSKGSSFSSSGHQFSTRGSPRRAAGKACFVGFCPLPSSPPGNSLRSSLGSDFHGRMVVGRVDRTRPKKGALQAVPVQMSLCIGKAMKWWEKGLQPNMREIHSAQHLVDSLHNAGNKLVIVDFFSPGCGGCKALHPKICQFAEMSPDVVFLHINYEEHKSMCYSLNVHVLPFFRFYRGAQGRLCSFSCTNATIKKFKDALAKHNTDRCSLGPAKGLEESELLALAANKELSFTYTKRPEAVPDEPIQSPEPVAPTPKLPFSPAAPKAARDSEERVVAAAGR
uniref:Thioredoxin-like 1-2, chloroplastic n=1 Tax=Anthurium amnicola TaxID=1678845 RepID=A0A1D1YB24_9ARAE